MAERLTEKKNDKYVIDGFKTDFAVGLRKNCLHSLYGEPVNKLGKLEDILEKYGIESVEELEKKLADADTWQKACEFLAYKYAEEYFDGRDIEHCFNANKRDKFVKENINYFYQQAKKEGNDE